MKYIIPLLLCLAAIVFVLATFTGCNPAKRTFNNAAYKYNPKTKQDSINLLTASEKVLKPVAPKTLPGKTIRVPYPVNKIVTILDSSRLRSITDSLYLANGQILDCTRQVEEACKACRQQAYYELRNETYETKEPDTVLIPDPAIQAALQLANMQLIDTSIQLRSCRAEIASNERKMDSIGWTAKRTLSLLWGQWWWWVLLAGLGAGTYFKLRKKIPLLP